MERKYTFLSGFGVAFGRSSFSLMTPYMLTTGMENVFDSQPSRIVPTQGRRAVRESATKLPREETFSASQVISPVVSQIKLDNSDDTQLPKLEKPGRRRQMWNAVGEEAEDERLRIDSDSDGSEGIPTIPDLEQLNDEPLIDQIAAPPSAIFNELLSYHELDSDLMRQSAFQLLDNEIDLKVLTKALVPEKDTMESDETWEMDKLFAEMQSMVTCCNKNIIGQEAVEQPDRKVLI